MSARLRASTSASAGELVACRRCRSADACSKQGHLSGLRVVQALSEIAVAMQRARPSAPIDRFFCRRYAKAIATRMMIGTSKAILPGRSGTHPAIGPSSLMGTVICQRYCATIGLLTEAQHVVGIDSARTRGRAAYPREMHEQPRKAFAGDESPITTSQIQRRSAQASSAA